jgi:predicted Zn-dependent peptidase
MAIQVTHINPQVTLVTEEMNHLSSTVMGFFVPVGSRYEEKDQQGITHLVEHMIFKGTKHKSAQDIAREFESLGATMDGFTSKEIGGIFFHFLADSFDKVFHLFFELIRNINITETELAKEKNVILQELLEGYENPQEHAYSLFSEIMFPDHPLSFPVIGTQATINAITTDDLIKHLGNVRTDYRLCISIAGRTSHLETVDKLQKLNLSYLNKDYLARPFPPSSNVERTIVFQSRPDLQHVHTIAGFLTIPLNDPRRYALTILNNIIGGTASSRANQRLREKEGMLHTMFTFLDLYSDVGLWCVYHTSDIKNRERSLNIAMEELAKFKKFGITREEFERSVNFSKGMLALSAEDPMSRMTRNANKFLLLGRTVSIEESISAFDNLTYDYVNSLVAMFKLEQYSGAIIGPIKKEDLGRIGAAPHIIIEKTQ